MQDILSMKHGLNDKRLVDICGIQYGCPFDASLFSTSSYEGMPLIRIRDVKGGQTETYYSGEYSPEFIIRKGDYLIGMDGEFNIAPWQSEDALLNQRVCKIYTKSHDVVIRYVYRFLQKELKKIEDETPFVTVKHLSAKRLNQVYLPVPPIAEQEKIVAELDCLSGIIEKKKQQLKELDALAQSIFYEMFGDPVENDKGWETSPIKDVAPQQVYKGNVPCVNGKYWLLNLDVVVSNTGEVLQKCYFELSEIGNSTITFSPENVLYSKLRPYLNKVVLPNDIGYATSELIPLCPNKDLLDRVFLAHLLRSSQFVTYISNKVAGAKMPRVSMGDFRTFPVMLPPLALQQEFAFKIESIEKQKELISQSIKETETLFNSRMDYYFN